MKKSIKITSCTALILGLFFLLVISSATRADMVQYAVVGFFMGFAIPWIVYLALWFISKGFRRTAFPLQSRYILLQLAKAFKLHFSSYQKKMYIEVIGSILMVCTGLALACAVFLVVSGLVYVSGALRW